MIYLMRTTFQGVELNYFDIEKHDYAAYQTSKVFQTILVEISF